MNHLANDISAGAKRWVQSSHKLIQTEGNGSTCATGDTNETGILFSIKAVQFFYLDIHLVMNSSIGFGRL